MGGSGLAGRGRTAPSEGLLAEAGGESAEEMETADEVEEQVAIVARPTKGRAAGALTLYWFWKVHSTSGSRRFRGTGSGGAAGESRSAEDWSHSWE